MTVANTGELNHDETLLKSVIPKHNEDQKSMVAAEHKLATTNHQMENFITCMVRHFTSALDKICKQQSDMFMSKLNLINTVYNKSIQANEERFSKMMD